MPTAVIMSQLRLPLVIAAFVALSSSHSNGSGARRVASTSSLWPCATGVAAPAPNLIVVHGVAIPCRRPVPTDVTTPQLRPMLVIATSPRSFLS